MSEITWDWVRVVLNQYRLTFCDKPAVSRESIIDVSVFDCKKSVGDFSSTYQVISLEKSQVYKEKYFNIRQLKYRSKFL